MNILIICAGGMSSSIVVKKTKEAARKRDSNIKVEESSTFDVDSKKENFDVFLVAPQVKYLAPKLTIQVGGKPVGIIPPTDYATMNGNKIIDFALKLANK